MAGRVEGLPEEGGGSSGVTCGGAEMGGDDGDSPSEKRRGTRIRGSRGS